MPSCWPSRESCGSYGEKWTVGVRLREVATGRLLGCFESHTAPVLTVAFSPDGRTALSAGHENVIRLLKLPEPDADQRAAPEE